MTAMQTESISLDIPYIKLKFCAELLEDTTMPSSKVSALRGGMGEMILRQNCVCDRACETCMFHKSCIVMHTMYSYMEKKPSYVTGKESVGYLIECENYSEEYAKGDILEFNLVLFGESIAYFNIYLQAFHNLGMQGIGKNHSRFMIREICNEAKEPILRENTVNMERYRIHTVDDYVRRRREKLAGGERYRIVFTTPLCMKYQKEYLERFDSAAILQGILRRVQMLNYYTGHEAEFPEITEYPRVASQQAVRGGIKRYSSTHDSKMSLRGITGNMTLEEVSEECLDYLIAGELLHLGKNTSFGFGKYQVYRVIGD